jgi:hypothetical protein
MTLADLRTAVRRRADQENSRFISDAELNTYINASYAELYDLLVSRFADYFMKDPPTEFTLTGSTSSQALPADYYKTRGVDISLGGDWVPLSSWMFAERNHGKRYDRCAIRYRIVGGKLMFTPEGSAAGTYRHWYIPRYTPLALDADEMDDVMDLEEYVVVDAAIKCLIKEESDPSVLILAKNSLIQRVNAMAADRDAGEPQRVTDVSGFNIGIDELYPRF